MKHHIFLKEDKIFGYLQRSHESYLRDKRKELGAPEGAREREREKVHQALPSGRKDGEQYREEERQSRGAYIYFTAVRYSSDV